MVSLSVSNYRHSTSKKTSMRHWKSVLITSFSTAAAAEPARHRSYSVTISRCRPFRHLARARRHLDSSDSGDVTLIITGGLRHPADFAKALALGADGIAVSNAALQAIGCLGMRACHTNNCPVGIATQKTHLRERLPVDIAAERLARFFSASVELMTVLARAAGHRHLGDFSHEDLTTFNADIASLTGVEYGGIRST